MSLYEDDSELEAIKRRKLLELQKRLEEEQRRRELEERIEAQRQELIRRILTSRARERLSNLKLVKPELARMVEDTIIQLVQAGRVSVPVDDDVVVNILMEIDRSRRRDFEIRIKRK